MTALEKIELALIAVLGAAVWMLAPALPGVLVIGGLLMGMSALLLLQGLARDLWLLTWRKRNAAPPAAPARTIRCMCVESTVGAVGVIMAIALLGAGWGRPIALDRWNWSLLAVATLAIGFLVKDFVLQWVPWRVRRERDHLNIVFKWRP